MDRHIAQVRITRWDSSFLFALDAVSKREGVIPVELAVREDERAQTDHVLVYLDTAPGTLGRYIIMCHPLDRERVELIVGQGYGRIRGIEAVPGGQSPWDGAGGSLSTRS